MKQFDIVITGGGISGWLMYQRIKQCFGDNLSIIILDKSDELPVHPFHLHRLIPEIKPLSNIKDELLRVEIWDGKESKETPSCFDVNAYSRKIFNHLNVSNINNAKNQIIYPITIEKLKSVIVNSSVFQKSEIVNVDIKNNSINVKIGNFKEAIQYKYCINTISLPIFLNLCGLQTNIPFFHYPFWCSVHTMDNHTNLYQMIYNSGMESTITRTTLLNNKLFIEYCKNERAVHEYDYLKELYGIEIPLNTARRQLVPGRIVPLSNEQRKPLFYWLTQTHNVMCLGRYGAWTFKISNDVWDDTEFLCKLIYDKEQSCKYQKGERDES